MEGLPRGFDLRLTGNRVEYLGGMAWVSTTWQEDRPGGWAAGGSPPPEDILSFQDPLYLDGRSSRSLGAEILKGTLGGILSLPAPKPIGEQTSRFTHGAQIAGGFGKRVGQTLQLHLLFRGARAIASYFDFIAQLGQPGGHRLYCQEVRDWLGCYYRGGRVEHVLLGEAQWLQCALELQVYDFPTEGLHATGYALGDEAGRLLLPPEGLLYLGDRKDNEIRVRRIG